MALTEQDLTTVHEYGIDPEDQKYKTLLTDLQGNILKGHGRDHSVHLFIQFKPDKLDEAKQWIQSFARKYVTSAYQQAAEAKIYREQNVKGSLFANFFLSRYGYEYLEVKPFRIPRNSPFRSGMKNDGVRNLLGDPVSEAWETGYQDQIHALILMADDDVVDLLQEVNRMSQKLMKVAEILNREDGFILRNKNGQAIEHFGYVDGISQPLFLKRDIEKDQEKHGTERKWDCRAPLSLVLEQDRNGQTEDSYGSYLVYRKLEQNVRAFKEEAHQLAEHLGINDELAGALVVGRFKDGTPVTASSVAKLDDTNNFDLENDAEGLKCPFHSHARKTNPRGDTGRVGSNVNYDESLATERGHRITRRGISYGENDLSRESASGSGLLFLCFQADIENQFNFMQASWANQNNFVNVNTGPDPIIGQQDGTHKWPTVWGEKQTKECKFKLWVNMKGGEYFFAPCLSFLKTLSPESETLTPETLDSLSPMGFDGKNDYISIPDHPSLRVKNYTVEVWIKPAVKQKVNNPYKDWQGIFGKPGRNFNIWLAIEGYIHHRFKTPAGWNAGGAPNTPEGTIEWENWYHIAITNDGTTAKTYVNGELITEGPVEGDVIVNNSPLYIGRSLDGDSSRYFYGCMAEARLWDNARSPEEIKANMNKRLSGYEDGLVGYWLLNERYGNIVPDCTSNANSGIYHITQKLTPKTLDSLSPMSFNGQNDHISVEHNSSFDLTHNFTIEAWMNANEFKSYQRIVAKFPAYGFGLSNNQIIFTTFGIKDYITTQARLSLNQWYHVAVVLDNSYDAQFYLNGELLQTISGDRPPRITTTPLEIGSTTNSEYWHGKIAELRLWNKVRSAEEIKANMNKRLTGYEEGLVGYFE